jgi:hypothetical protein
MNLTHDIEFSSKEKKNITCVFLNVKEAYDYVSIKQLLNVMKKLQLSSQVLKWIEEFMNDRSIELAFDDKKQEKRQIRIEILQRSFDLIDFLFNLHKISFCKYKNRCQHRNVKLCRWHNHLYVVKKNRTQLWKIESSDFESIWMSTIKCDQIWWF